MVNVAVIGRGGFLGSAILGSLSELENFKVIGVGGRIRNLQSAETFHDELSTAEVIVNCAGPSAEHCEKFPADAYDYYHNYQGRLLDYCNQFTKRLISFSTMHVYDASHDVISENTPRVSAHPYVRYRQEFEDRIAFNQTYNHVILRLGNCFGESESKSKQKNKLIINSMINAFHSGKIFEVLSDVDFHRTYVPMTYLSSIVKKIILGERLDSPIINVSAKSSTPISEIIMHLESMSQRNFINHNFTSVGRRLVFDNEKCDRILSFDDDLIYKELRAMMFCGS